MLLQGGNHDVKYKIKILIIVYTIGGGNVKDTIGYIQNCATETFHEFTSLWSADAPDRCSDLLKAEGMGGQAAGAQDPATVPRERPVLT